MKSKNKKQGLIIPAAKKELQKPSKVDSKYLLETLIKLDTNDADALFISCTALPALEIIDEVEKKIGKIVLSSNQTLIWDTLRSVGYKSSVQGYGKLLRN